MPALVKSNVGSLAGRSGDERTVVCPCSSKYFRKASRSSLPVIIESSLPDIRVIREISGQSANFVAHQLKLKSLAQQVIEQAPGFRMALRSPADSQPLRDGLVYQLLFGSFSVDHLQRFIGDTVFDLFQLQVALEPPAAHR